MKRYQTGMFTRNTQSLRRLLEGFWFCNDCEQVTERIEDDHGQPAHCARCRSHRITWNKPALQLEAAV